MASVKGICIISFEAGKRGIKHLPARDDDDVHTGRDLMTPKNLSSDPFGAVTLDRVPELAAGGNPQPRHGSAVLRNEQGHETRRNSYAGGIGPLEIRPAAHPLRG